MKADQIDRPAVVKPGTTKLLSGLAFDLGFVQEVRVGQPRKLFRPPTVEHLPDGRSLVKRIRRGGSVELSAERSGGLTANR